MRVPGLGVELAGDGWVRYSGSGSRPSRDGKFGKVPEPRGWMRGRKVNRTQVEGPSPGALQ